MVRASWGKGSVELRALEIGGARYVCGYIQKKLNGRNVGDAEILQGRYREFARMSLRPGIGVGAIARIAESLKAVDFEGVDVPGAVRRDGSIMSYGPMMKRKLRAALGRDVVAPQEVLDEWAKAMLPLRLAARASEENPSVKKRLVEANQGAIASISARASIYKKRIKL